MFTDFILVRHGETDYNKLHVIQGWVDIPLNETGHQQAAVTAEMLRCKIARRIWQSPHQARKEKERNQRGESGFCCVF